MDKKVNKNNDRFALHGSANRDKCVLLLSINVLTIGKICKHICDNRWLTFYSVIHLPVTRQINFSPRKTNPKYGGYDG